MQETSSYKKIVSLFNIDCGNFDIREFNLNSGASDLILQSVSRSSFYYHFVVKSSGDDFRIIKMINLGDTTDTAWTEYKPLMITQTSVSGFVYGDHSLYLSIKAN